MLPLLPRGARLTVAPELGRLLGRSFDRTLGPLLRATLPPRLMSLRPRLMLPELRPICGALWLRLTRGALWLRLTLPALRFTCGARLRLTLLELRLVF